VKNSLSTKLNLLDYFYEIFRICEEKSFEKVLLMQIFQIATISSIRIIENISFKNTSLSILSQNLNIDFTKDEDYNYKTFNVPKIFKNIIVEVLNIKQNLSLL